LVSWGGKPLCMGVGCTLGNINQSAQNPRKKKKRWKVQGHTKGNKEKGGTKLWDGTRKKKFVCKQKKAPLGQVGLVDPKKDWTGERFNVGVREGKGYERKRFLENIKRGPLGRGNKREKKKGLLAKKIQNWWRQELWKDTGGGL